MIRTQIYIHQHTHQKLQWLTKRKGSSMADLVRKFIEEGLKKESTEDVSEDDNRRRIDENIRLVRKLSGGFNLGKGRTPEEMNKDYDREVYGSVLS